MAVKARPPAGGPLCAICTKEMALVRSKLNPARPSFQAQTFECSDCGTTQKCLVER
jgi:hypothetical protein